MVNSGEGLAKTMQIKYPDLAELVEEGLRQIKRQGKKAKDVAIQAHINETHLSMVRKGIRGLSQDKTVGLARALYPDSRVQEKYVLRFLLAAGYTPENLAPGKKPVLSNPYTLDGFLEILSRPSAVKEVWFFSRSIQENGDQEFRKATLSNLGRGVKYTYFIHRSNALDFVKLKEDMESFGFDFSSGLCQGILVPDHCFHYTDPRFLHCVLNPNQIESLRLLHSVREDSDLLYREATNQDAAAFRDYLSEFLSEASKTGSATPPVTIARWLKERYNLRIGK
jgi:hypothetical protein